MSNMFRVDTAQIAASNAAVGRISAEIDSQVAAMMANLEALQSGWQGSASANFQAVAAEWRATQARVRESLDHINQALHSAGVNYAQTESANTALFAG